MTDVIFYVWRKKEMLNYNAFRNKDAAVMQAIKDHLAQQRRGSSGSTDTDRRELGSSHGDISDAN
jgi:hypothetical protein